MALARAYLKVLGSMLIFLPYSVVASPLDGLWSGGYTLGQSQYNVQGQVDFADGYGLLRLNIGTSIAFVERLRSGDITLPENARYEVPGEQFAATSYRCTYFLRKADDGLETILNLEQSGPTCESDPEISLTPNDQGLTFLYQSNFVDDTFEMQLGIGPLPENRLAELPDGFDILGVAPGNSMQEAISTLETQGYREFEPQRVPTITASDWSQTTRIFVKGEQQGSDQFPRFSDAISIVESTRVLSNPDLPSFALIIARTRQWGESEGISVEQLFSAISGKYGAPDDGSVRDSYRRFFDLDGEPDPRQRAGQHTSCRRQGGTVSYQIPPLDTGRLRMGTDRSAACGSQFVLISDTRGSLISRFTIILDSDPLLIRDVWRRFAGQVTSEARQEFERLDQQNPDSNDLDL